MVRPEYKRVDKLLTSLIREALPGNSEKFFKRLRTLSTYDEHIHPVEAYVYDALLAEMKISAADADPALQFLPINAAYAPSERVRKATRVWNRTKVGMRWIVCFPTLAGNPTHQADPKLDDFRASLIAIRFRLRESYHGKRGGSRDHDLGWVIDRLADIYESAGGKVKVSSHFDARANYNERLWTDDSDFARFCRAFRDCLPDTEAARRVDMGRLIRRCLSSLRLKSRSYRKR